LKWVFKSFPLAFHLDSKLAHIALLAAGRQNSFWEMHDLIFAHQGSLSREELRAMGQKLGLDMARFDADLVDPKLEAMIDGDMAEGARLEVDGTPTFFINGKPMIGSVPLVALRQAVDEEIRKRRGEQWADAGAGTEDNFQPARLGRRDAPVTVTWFSDVQSPSATSARMLVQKALAAYPEALRVVLKQVALDFHPNAQLAHEASLAAGMQGKFWEMYDLVLSNAKVVQRSELLHYAARLNLDVDRFAKDLDDHRLAATLEGDAEEAKAWAVTGSPVFFVNAKRFDGVPAFDIFRATIEQELGSREQHAALGGGPGR